MVFKCCSVMKNMRFMCFSLSAVYSMLISFNRRLGQWDVLTYILPVAHD